MFCDVCKFSFIRKLSLIYCKIGIFLFLSPFFFRTVLGKRGALEAFRSEPRISGVSGQTQFHFLSLFLRFFFFFYSLHRLCLQQLIGTCVSYLSVWDSASGKFQAALLYIWILLQQGTDERNVWRKQPAMCAEKYWPFVKHNFSCQHVVVRLFAATYLRNTSGNHRPWKQWWLI